MTEPGAICAILFAAGLSSRFGGANKLLAELDGEPLVLRSARAVTALGLGANVAICGVDHGVEALLEPLGFHILRNPAPERGLSSSLASGIAFAEREGAEAALLCLADMPFAGTGHLRALLDAFDPVSAPVVASEDGATVSPPAIFASRFFPELRALSGDQGARTFLRSAVRVAAPAGSLRDIDTPSDLP